MPVALSDENRSITPTYLAFLVAFVILTILAILLFLIFSRLLGAADLVSAGVAVVPYSSITMLQQPLERKLLARRNISTARLDTPTLHPLRMFAYATSIVFGYYGSNVLFSNAVKWPAGFLAFLPIGLAAPTLSYLVGEWIGRSLAKRRNALLVAAGATLLALTLAEGIVDFFIGASRAFAQPYVWGLTMGVSLLWVIIPILVGAFRGARYKRYYDLAFFAKRLPRQEQEKIEDFVQRIQQEYVTTAPAGPH